MASYENIIKEQRTHITATISKKLIDDYDLFIENGGPGGAYDKFIYGDVITNIDSYHAQLKEHLKKTTDQLNKDLKDKAYYEKVNN